MTPAAFRSACAKLAACPGWTEVVKPRLQALVLSLEARIIDEDSTVEALLQSKAERKHLLAFFDMLAADFDAALAAMEPVERAALTAAGPDPDQARAELLRLFDIRPNTGTKNEAPRTKNLPLPEQPSYNPFDPTTVPPEEAQAQPPTP